MTKLRRRITSRCGPSDPLFRQGGILFDALTAEIRQTQMILACQMPLLGRRAPEIRRTHRINGNPLALRGQFGKSILGIGETLFRRFLVPLHRPTNVFLTRRAAKFVKPREPILRAGIAPGCKNFPG